ncbi:MAG: hypothetical protein O3B73_11325 [bacterium]|nr:hypothetical protein [bacterium]
MASGQKELPVLVDAVMGGVLGQADLLKGLRAQGEQALSGDWMQREIH